MSCRSTAAPADTSQHSTLLNLKFPIRIVQAHGIHLSRLLFLGDGAYALLQQLRDRFVRSIPEYREERREVVCREPEEPAERAVKECPSPVSVVAYEPSHISNVFDSVYWGWRRFRAYYRYVHDEELMEKRDREVQEFMKG